MKTSKRNLALAAAKAEKYANGKPTLSKYGRKQRQGANSDA